MLENSWNRLPRTGINPHTFRHLVWGASHLQKIKIRSAYGFNAGMVSGGTWFWLVRDIK
jgi:hypothetical protein